MRLSSLACTLLAAPLLLALAPRADEITFHPRDDSTLKKKFTIKTEMELGDVNCTVNDQDVTGELPSDASFGGEISAEIVDHFIKVQDGKPLELVREFVKSTAGYDAMDETGSEDDFFGLDGKKARFQWNADEKRYDISPDWSKDKVNGLDVLAVDMDLRSLLPGKSVSQGDHWDVDGKQLASALLPGIDLEHFPDLETLIDADGDEETTQGLQWINRDFLPQFTKFRDQCKASCEYTGQRDVDGHKLAAIKIKFDVVSSLDMTEFIRMGMKLGGDVDEADYKIDNASLKLTVKSEGELLWDIAAGHAHGFDLTAKLECEAKLVMSAKVEEQEYAVDGNAEFSGNCHWTMELE